MIEINVSNDMQLISATVNTGVILNLAYLEDRVNFTGAVEDAVYSFIHSASNDLMSLTGVFGSCDMWHSSVNSHPWLDL